jgi:hypothetical protein
LAFADSLDDAMPALSEQLLGVLRDAIEDGVGLVFGLQVVEGMPNIEMVASNFVASAMPVILRGPDTAFQVNSA